MRLQRASGCENVKIAAGLANGRIDSYAALEINSFLGFKVVCPCKRYANGGRVSRAQVVEFMLREV